MQSVCLDDDEDYEILHDWKLKELEALLDNETSSSLQRLSF